MSLALVVQGARIAWVFLGPEKAPPPAPPRVAGPTGADPAILTRASLFDGDLAVDGFALPATDVVDIQNLGLFGLRTAGPGGPSAIIGAAGGAQASYRIGDEVAPGLVLSAVAADHVVLSRSGVPVRLDLTTAPSGAAYDPNRAARIAGSVRPPSAPTVDTGRFLAEAGLTPRTEQGETRGYAVVPQGGPLLGQVGLASGDVILAVNGRPLTPTAYAGLASQLADASAVNLTVERDGRQRTVTLQNAR